MNVPGALAGSLSGTCPLICVRSTYGPAQSRVNLPWLLRRLHKSRIKERYFLVFTRFLPTLIRKKSKLHAHRGSCWKASSAQKVNEGLKTQRMNVSPDLAWDPPLAPTCSV